MRGRGGGRSVLIQVSPAMMDGLASGQADGRGHDVGGMLPPTGRAVGGALKVTQSNNGMHPTADTLPLNFGNLVGRRVMPGVMPLRVYAQIGAEGDGGRRRPRHQVSN